MGRIVVMTSEFPRINETALQQRFVAAAATHCQAEFIVERDFNFSYYCVNTS